MLASGKEKIWPWKICALDSNIQFYCSWVNSYRVMRWHGGEKRKRNLDQLSLKLQEFWIEWPWYSTCFILLYRFVWNVIPPSAFIELCESYTEYGRENACRLPVKHTRTFFVYELEVRRGATASYVRTWPRWRGGGDCRDRGMFSHATSPRALIGT